MFSDDAQNHWDFIHTNNCESGYPNGLCLSLQWLDLSEWGTWFFFLGLSLLIPLFFVIYQRDIRLFPLFFVFTGFFWNTMLMQVFTQIWLSVMFVFFIFHKNQKHRLLLLNVLLFLLLIGVKFHNQEFIVLIGVLGIELMIIVKRATIQFIEDHPEWEYAVACGVLPVSAVEKATSVARGVRGPMASGTNNWFQGLIYYAFSFFVENMFIGFVVPGVYFIFKQKWWRFMAYFFMVVIGAFAGWVYLGFTIWYVTRVLIWLPLVLFVPFIRWLDAQTKNTKLLFYVLGVGYFVFNVYFFLMKMMELGCGV